jgi:antirestriction protein ArdC
VSEKIYQLVTDSILALLEQGVVPWKKRWRTGNGSILPLNLVSRRPYRGVNVFLLVAQATAHPTGLPSSRPRTEVGECAAANTVRRSSSGVSIA